MSESREAELRANWARQKQEHGKQRTRLYEEGKRMRTEESNREAQRVRDEAPPDEVPLAVAASESREELELQLATDTRNAERFADQWGHMVRYCQPWKKWLLWDGRRWAPDGVSRVMLLSKDTVRSIAREAEAEENSEKRRLLMQWAAKSEDARRRDNLIRLAQGEGCIPVEPEALDKNPWLLNVNNGVLNLQTGELGEHNPSDLMTKLAPVDFDAGAEAPTWDAFLRRITDNDEEQIGFLQRVAGYMLTGDVSAEVALFFVGAGANGKTTFLRALQDMLGDYAKTVSTDLVVGEEKSGGATPERMALKGTRVAVAMETSEGCSLNAASLKQITSRDRISARALYQDASEFEPSHKLIMGTNHEPRVKSADEGTWRRILLVPFSVTIPESERNPHLLEDLREEHPGILRWAVEGCKEWLARGAGKEGLAIPQTVAEATSGYREGEDTLASFISDVCVQHESARVKQSALFEAYCKWAEANRDTPLTKTEFKKRAKGLKGVTESKNDVARIWKGVGLRDGGTTGQHGTAF